LIYANKSNTKLCDTKLCDVQNAYYVIIIYMQIILIISPIRKHFERQSNNVQSH